MKNQIGRYRETHKNRKNRQNLPTTYN